MYTSMHYFEVKSQRWYDKILYCMDQRSNSALLVLYIRIEGGFFPATRKLLTQHLGGSYYLDTGDQMRKCLNYIHYA